MVSVTNAIEERPVELDGFRRLLARLDSDPVRAWQAYEDLRKKLVTYFEYNHHRDLQAVELAEEALDRIAKRPDVQALESVVEFAFGVARNLRKQNLRRNSLRIDVPDMEIVASTSHGDNSVEDVIINRIVAERKLLCYQKALQDLSAEEREVVRRYYPAENGDLEGLRLKLAADLGINIGALRTRMARIREKLQDGFDRYHSAANYEHSQKSDFMGDNFCVARSSNISDEYRVATTRIEIEKQGCVRARQRVLQK